MSHCGLSGNLPSDLMQMWSLENLDLSFNSFSGKINFSQWSFGDNESRLEHLDISHNLLEASHIEEWPKMLYLKGINLSYNYFKGELPGKILKSLMNDNESVTKLVVEAYDKNHRFKNHQASNSSSLEQLRFAFDPLALMNLSSLTHLYPIY